MWLNVGKGTTTREQLARSSMWWKRQSSTYCFRKIKKSRQTISRCLSLEISAGCLSSSNRDLQKGNIRQTAESQQQVVQSVTLIIEWGYCKICKQVWPVFSIVDRPAILGSNCSSLTRSGNSLDQCLCFLYVLSSSSYILSVTGPHEFE